MVYTVSEENFSSIRLYLEDKGRNLHWSSVFILPSWLQTWWQIFGAENEILLRSVSRDGDIIGIAPLMRKGRTAGFLGSTDVCDYMDFIIMPGMEAEFFHVLLDDLRSNGIEKLDLAHVRPESLVLEHLKSLAESTGCKVQVIQEEISLEADLPGDWDAYLESLTRKQRHEIRRKLRRLYEAGQIDYRFIDDVEPVVDAMDTFIGLFTGSRQDKAEFLTEKMEAFFRLLAGKMSEAGLLKFGVLNLNEKPIASILCFDYHDCVYLYNSGYDHEYDYLSAGLLSKVLGIRESIQNGKKRFDFLKGSEPYKYHLGGREVALSRCVIDICQNMDVL